MGFILLQVLYWVGDAGALKPAQLRHYQSLWQKVDTPALLIQLGDNLYPSGYKKSSPRWRRFLACIKSFPGPYRVIPGNHDWKAGIEGVRRQAQDVGYWYPPVGQCGPVLEVYGRWALLYIDSERLIRWADTQEKKLFWATVDSFFAFLPESLVGVWVAHHPIVSAGAHGGHFPWQQHLFPLRIFHPLLFIPLPIVGSLYVWIRKKASHPTDISWPGYKAYAEGFMQRLQHSSRRWYYISGHEHNLQFHQIGRSYAIVSGSGCKYEPLRKKKAGWAKACVGLWRATPTGKLEALKLKKAQLLYVSP